METFFIDATVLKCSLGNSTYRLDFIYEGTTGQHISVSQTVINETIPKPVTSLLQAAVTGSDQLALQTLGLRTKEFPQENDTSAQIDGQILREWSYQSIASAFKPIVLGAIGRGSLDSAVLSAGNSSKSSTRYYRSNVFSSSLADTKALAALAPGLPTAYGLTGKMPSSKGYAQAWSLLNPPNGTQTRRALQDTLEELFRNITIAMASSPDLRYDGFSPLAPAGVDVTFHNYANIFVYSPGKLWLAYGIALGATSLCAIVGLLAIYSGQASFTTSFSTILRATRNARLSVELPSEDSPGKDPLPKEVAQAKFRIQQRPASITTTRAGTQYSKVTQNIEIDELTSENSNSRTERQSE